MTINTASKMLTDAASAITDRQAKYGPPSKNFANIAALWQAHLRGRYGELATLTIDAADVAVMSALIKVARLAETPDHEDSWVDLAGYAACGRQVTAPGTAQKVIEGLEGAVAFVTRRTPITWADHGLHTQDCVWWGRIGACDCGAVK